jgi:hypothetical protein
MTPEIGETGVPNPMTLRPTWKENLYTLLVVGIVLGAILS